MEEAIFVDRNDDATDPGGHNRGPIEAFNRTR